MLKRTIAITLLLLLSVGLLVPLVGSTHGVRQNSEIGQRRHHHRYRSRAWWRRYHARLRKKRAAAAAALAHRNALLTLPANLNLGNFVVVPESSSAAVASNATAENASMPVVDAPTIAMAAPVVARIAMPAVTAPTVAMPAVNTPAVAMPAIKAPGIVMPPRAAKNAAAHVVSGPFLTNAKIPVVAPTVVTSTAAGPVLVNNPVVVNPTPTTPRTAAEARPVTEAKVLPKNPMSPLPGELSISVVALSRPNPAFLTPREGARLLAGVAVADLRRIVIDKMINAGGWVTNDYVREISGGRVFVVTARTPKNGQTPEKAWTFYFTESAGRIYSLTTDSPVEHTERMSREAERFLGTLRSTTLER